jgi:D-alanyl-D-alanine carboxypeptidase (penicillin-binding protein 5/6)
VKRLLAVILGALALAFSPESAPHFLGAPGEAAAAGAAPRPDASAWLVENAATGEVLAAHAAAARLPVASITKLMTVLVTLDHAKLDDVVVVSSRTSRIGESTIELRAGERIAVRDLIEAALIQSANDAASALAEHVGGGSVARFVALMNAQARAFGLADTHFVNPSGLDAPGHYSSARDVTTLARIAMRKPFVRRTVRLRTEGAAGRTLHTWNDLLGGFPGVVGVKTGHTEAAGWSQVAAARGPGLTIYATVLGSPTRDRRNADLAALLAWGLSRYRVVEAIDDDRVYATATTGYGRAPVRLVAPEPLRRSIRVDRSLVERIVAPSVVSLPVAKGQRLGVVRVYARGKLLGERPLVASELRTAPGLGGKIRWYATRTVENAWGLIF